MIHDLRILYIGVRRGNHNSVLISHRERQSISQSPAGFSLQRPEHLSLIGIFSKSNIVLESLFRMQVMGHMVASISEQCWYAIILGPHCGFHEAPDSHIMNTKQASTRAWRRRRNILKLIIQSSENGSQLPLCAVCAVVKYKGLCFGLVFKVSGGDAPAPHGPELGLSIFSEPKDVIYTHTCSSSLPVYCWIVVDRGPPQISNSPSQQTTAAGDVPLPQYHMIDSTWLFPCIV